MPDSPFFSIVVPTFERHQELAACLEALVKLDYPKDRYEVIVVNDGGSELPPSMVDHFSGSPQVTFHTQKNAGPATARNVGVDLAEGEYVAFTDDDCLPQADWLTHLAVAFERRPNAMVGGRTVNQLVDNAYSVASQSLIDALYAYYNHDPDNARFLTSNNLALPADQFRSFHGFDERFPLAAAEDRDLCDRWYDLGWPIAYAPDAIVRHAHQLNLHRFLSQHFRYGRGALHFQRRRQDRSKRTKIEPFSFYWGLISHPWSEPLRWRKFPVSALIFVSQAINAAGFFWEKLLRRV